MTFEEFNNRCMQAVEKFEALRFDELSRAEVLQAILSISEFKAELVAFEEMIRAELQRRAVAAQLN